MKSCLRCRQNSKVGLYFLSFSDLDRLIDWLTGYTVSFRCVKQLRRRLAKKRRRLAELQKEIAEQEACSNQVCVMSERLQHEVEDKRLSQSQSVGVTHLRSVAYGLSRAQYQSDDVTREVEFCKEMNTSQYNAFNNELHWKVFLYREKTQVINTNM